MDNPFSKVPKNKKVSLQQNVAGEVVKRKAGRPQKKGMRRYAVRLLEAQHYKISAYCEKNGVGFSQFIQSLVSEKFKELEKPKESVLATLGKILREYE